MPKQAAITALLSCALPLLIDRVSYFLCFSLYKRSIVITFTATLSVVDLLYYLLILWRMKQAENLTDQAWL